MISVEDLVLQVGDFRLQNLSLDVDREEYLIIIGPTGCGKTLLMETICGLNVPDNGAIYIDGREVTRKDPAERKIGYVPQDYALLPFKTVEENIAFGLQAYKCGRKKMKERLQMVMEMLDIKHLRRRYPANLSGGELQRVALGRALAIEPDVLVLDEPLSALDESTCRELMDRLKQLYSELNTTFIHICHRLEEALTLGSTLTVMRNGRIEQTGPVEEVFKYPDNLFVAGFLQLRNLTKGEIRKTPDGNMFYLNGTPLKATQLDEGEAFAVIPLEELSVYSIQPDKEDGYVVLEEKIAENRPGPHEPGLRFRDTIELNVPGIFPKSKWPRGKKIYLKFPVAKLHLLRE